MRTRKMVLLVLMMLSLTTRGFAEDWALQLRTLRETQPGVGRFERTVAAQTWAAGETAIIVCDVWDLHHCWNAVRRLEEFAPRLNQVLAEGRRRGATIIHAPSDCMPAYADHPARRRALAVPPAARLPHDITSWCSRIPAEEQAVYPLDQSDGGEDDDPAEHAAWAARLKSLGRNPGTPWQKQSELITIDADRDFISDKGDEVWNILQHRGIRHVILTGVHTNMCVLGRPFGLRQMTQNNMQVVLMRDMTDCMYNPQRWPYVDHFTGNDLIVAHVERFVCPTITSDQLLGGQPFRSTFDTRSQRDVVPPAPPAATGRKDFEKQWSLLRIPANWPNATGGVLSDYEGVAWYRCAVRVPREWLGPHGLQVKLDTRAGKPQAWLNGHTLRATDEAQGGMTFHAERAWVEADDANLLVLRVEHRAGDGGLKIIPIASSRGQDLVLKGRWQFRLGDDPAWSNIPLPARYGASPDIVFEPATR